MTRISDSLAFQGRRCCVWIHAPPRETGGALGRCCDVGKGQCAQDCQLISSTAGCSGDDGCMPYVCSPAMPPRPPTLLDMRQYTRFQHDSDADEHDEDDEYSDDGAGKAIVHHRPGHAARMDGCRPHDGSHARMHASGSSPTAWVGFVEGGEPYVSVRAYVCVGGGWGGRGRVMPAM